MLRLRFVPPLALLAPVLLLLQLGPGWADRLRFLRPRFEQGAWWEPFSAQFVHLSLVHALANAAAALLIAWLLRRGPEIQLQSGLLAGGLAGVALQLAFDADCAHYAGFSGALHGLLGGALASPSDRDRRVSPWRGFLLVLLLLKVGLELAGWLPAAWNFPVYYPSHAAGLAGGLCAAGLMRLARSQRAAPEPGQ